MGVSAISSRTESGRANRRSRSTSSWSPSRLPRSASRSGAGRYGRRAVAPAVGDLGARPRATWGAEERRGTGAVVAAAQTLLPGPTGRDARPERRRVRLQRVRLLVALFGYQIMHVLRTSLERATKTGWRACAGCWSASCARARPVHRVGPSRDDDRGPLRAALGAGRPAAVPVAGPGRLARKNRLPTALLFDGPGSPRHPRASKCARTG